MGNYLNLFNKASSLSTFTRLCLHQEQPLVTEFKIDSLGVLKYYLAPKISDDRDEKEWWSWFNKGLQNPSNDTQQQVTPVEHGEHPIDTVGQITREEWIERYGTDKDFDTYDTDGNGIVDAEEFRPQPESAKLNNTPTACSLGGNGTFILTCNVITRGGTTQQVLEVSPQDLVADVLARASPQFMAEMRHKGEFDKQPHDLSLLDAGFSRETECDIQVQCVPRPLEQNALYNQSLA